MFSRISIRRPVTTIMVTLMVFIAGIVAYTSLNLSLMPNVDIPVVLVSTSYVGAGPEEIENIVSKPLENALGTVNNVDTVTSISNSDTSLIIVQFVDGTDIDMASLDLRDVLDRAKYSLPDDVNDPIIFKIDMNAIPIYLGVTADHLDLKELNDLLEDNIMPRLERIEGVASIDSYGGIEKEVAITIDPTKLAGYNLNISALSQVLAAENMNLPSGTLSQGETKLQVRTMGQFSSVDEIRDLPIATPSGAIIQLSDVATVVETEKDEESISYVNNQKGMLIAVNKQSTANLVKTSDKIEKELNKISKEYPDLKISIVMDTSDYIKDSISNVTQTAFLSALIAFFVLMLFLKNPVTSGIIAVSIPTSILSTFALMYLAGMSLNIISMGGVAIGIGMLVDNSIVVLDSIYQYYERGYSPKEAAEIGAKEVTMAITASTLTTVAVFLPIAFTKGSVGQLLQNLSFSVTFALLSSLVVAITFVPMASALMLQKDKKTKLRKYKKFSAGLVLWDKILDYITQIYDHLLRWALANRKKTVLLILLVFIGSLATVPMTGMDFMEEMDEGTANISITLPNGTSLDTTEEVVLEALYRLQTIPEAETVYANIGSDSMSSNSAAASIYMNLVSKNQRSRSTSEVCEEIKTLLGNIPGMELSVSASQSAMGSSSSADVTFNVYGYDNNVLMDVENDIVELISNINGFSDVEGSTGTTVPEARVVIDRSKASHYGITTAAIANTLSTAISGTTATKYKVDGNELDVVLRYDTTQLNYLADLNNLTVTSASGSQIPLTDVANVEISESATSITRENQKNYITISANTKDMSASEAQKLIDGAMASYNFPDGCSYAYSGNMEMMMDSFRSLMLCMIIGVLLVYMIMASQFESLRYPFIVMFSMPLAITGGILGLFLTGHTITTPAFMGFVMLIGMVVNNGIVLVDYANQLMGRGLSCYDALVTAGPRRLRPILMTTLTTILGMLPMALSMREGGEMMKSLAIGVIFGLAFSTVVTLVFIPIIYIWMNERKERKKQKKEARKEKKALKAQKKATV
ncbi:swarming motility protein SwrC [Anaerotignum neopropionicum]|uniref:Swarming motility protein SwrC n=1 Tax=Anaerotignum neopropionicum TaxID=36847 RepID=A0A136WIB7_9FIRM|nr:efflux RND transporter permease subunit [Anaerotignum neopropionicum]KXL54183.1 swarming motility protein SwrC [Anaerotignum neopropionicum]KXL54308.1 swarming motility protein SwrC [Anaerotignum neopropionicum]